MIMRLPRRLGDIVPILQVTEADIQHLVRPLNVEAFGPSNIARYAISSAAEVSTSQDCSYSQIVRNVRRNNLGKECHSISTYFKSKQKEDESHYFAMDFDNDGSLRSVFGQMDDREWGILCLMIFSYLTSLTKLINAIWR